MFWAVYRPIFNSQTVLFFDSRMEQHGASWSCSKAIYKPVWHIPLQSVQWINSWWWTEELSDTCRVSCQNKFVKLVHLAVYIIKKFVTMHGHMNVKFIRECRILYSHVFQSGSCRSFMRLIGGSACCSGVYSASQLVQLQYLQYQMQSSVTILSQLHAPSILKILFRNAHFS